ncbi:MAG: serine hydrolase [Synergistaceae bacterium]|nr:serine hydrolase [Synergistaceae bacterium]
MRRLIIAVMISLCFLASAEANLTPVQSIPKYQWQKNISFPDWLGYTDDTLALNSMASFNFWHGQGTIYLKISKGVKSFRLFVNGKSLDTSSVSGGGLYKADISGSALNGTNTIQVSNIEPYGLKNAVEVFIPYPVVLEGRPEDEGINPETLALISDIISSDIAHGFTSAQLAVIRNGRMIYSNAWGKTDSTNPESPEVTRETLYDLASVSKVLSVNYAVQKLMTEGLIDVDMRVSDILGSGFLNDTISLKYKNTKMPSPKTMHSWKSSITIRDLMCHRAGYPSEIHYYDKHYDPSEFRHNDKAVNPLYSGIEGNAETRAKTLQAILRTPLMYEPRTKIIYSDIDYMLMCFIVEKVTGKTLDVYLQENFWRPMGLSHITYNPLKNGFSAADCAATEIEGNMTTRGYSVNIKGLRDYVIQGEVHDEKAYHSMNGVSGHAGIFANAEDTAKLVSAMLTGGYGGNKFFSRNVIDIFTSSQDKNKGQWGIGWWREGDNGRVWYFGSQSSSGTFGHQGFTGTLVMSDPSRNLVIAYFTNKLNSKAVKPLSRKKTFSGNWYTSSTLGFVSQILSIGMDSREDISEQLGALTADMAYESLKLIPKGAERTHPSVRNAESKIDLLMKRDEYADEAVRLKGMLPR